MGREARVVIDDDHFEWSGTARFQSAVTRDGFYLAAGTTSDMKRFAWAVYLLPKKDLLKCTTAPTMRGAKRQAEVFVGQDRAERASRGSSS